MNTYFLYQSGILLHLARLTCTLLVVRVGWIISSELGADLSLFGQIGESAEEPN